MPGDGSQGQESEWSNTVPFRPTRTVIVIKGSARRIFDQLSSIIGHPGSATRLELMSSIFEAVPGG